MIMLTGSGGGFPLDRVTRSTPWALENVSQSRCAWTTSSYRTQRDEPVLLVPIDRRLVPETPVGRVRVVEEDLRVRIELDRLRRARHRRSVSEYLEEPIQKRHLRGDQLLACSLR